MEDIKYNAKDNDVNMSSKNEEGDQDVTTDTETSRKRILVKRFLPLSATTKNLRSLQTEIISTYETLGKTSTIKRLINDKFTTPDRFEVLQNISGQKNFLQMCLRKEYSNSC